MAEAETRLLPNSVLAVLSTPELLELVLLRLDSRTLLTGAMRVSHHWHELVTKSPALQQALFFRPQDRSPRSPWTPMDNPLLSDALPAFFKPGGTSEKIRSDDFYKQPIAKYMKVFVNEDASWRRMLTQQPPVTKVGIWRSSDSMGGESHSFESVLFPTGLTMAWLYDTVQEWDSGIYSTARIARTSRANPNIEQLGGLAVDQQTETQVSELAAESDILLQLSSVVQCAGDFVDDDYYLFRVRLKAAEAAYDPLMNLRR